MSVDGHADGLFCSASASLAGVVIGANVAPSASIAQGGLVMRLSTSRRHAMAGRQLIIRGAFHGKQSAAIVDFPSDDAVMVSAEQRVDFALAETLSATIPVVWA